MDPTEYTVGWICPLSLEYAAARGMLDQEHDASKLPKHHRDTNIYCLGEIGVHKVVLTCLDEAGNNNAGSVANHMSNTFTNIQYGLLVGIGGGIPSRNHDIRLGDVVVSKPALGHRGIIQYESGKIIQGGEHSATVPVSAPHVTLLKAANHLRSNHLLGKDRMKHHIEEMWEKHPKLLANGYSSPGKERDQLFEAQYVHEGTDDSCADCDSRYLVNRRDRAEDEPVTHYGGIASGNRVMRDGVKRDQLGRDYEALCVEMEAAGLMEIIPCLIIRGICDYSDSHKNKDWQEYAATTAAAYAKELLGVVSLSNVEGMSFASNFLKAKSHWLVETTPPMIFLHCKISPCP